MNHKAAAPVEASENPPAEADVLEERAVNAGKAVTDGVDQHVALHGGQDLFYAGGRLVAGIRPELQLDQRVPGPAHAFRSRSEEHTSELQSRQYLHSLPTRRSSDLWRSGPLLRGRATGSGDSAGIATCPEGPRPGPCLPI